MSSQDDRPAVWDNPWEYDGSAKTLAQRIRMALAAEPGAQLLESNDDAYVHANVAAPGGAVDHVELYLMPGDNLVQFRAERIPRGTPDFGGNRRRLERLRVQLGLDKTIVLRARTTVLGLESPLDWFGPAEYDAEGVLR